MNSVAFLYKYELHSTVLEQLIAHSNSFLNIKLFFASLPWVGPVHFEPKIALLKKVKQNINCKMTNIIDCKWKSVIFLRGTFLHCTMVHIICKCFGNSSQKISKIYSILRNPYRMECWGGICNDCNYLQSTTATNLSFHSTGIGRLHQVSILV